MYLLRVVPTMPMFFGPKADELGKKILTLLLDTAWLVVLAVRSFTNAGSELMPDQFAPAVLDNAISELRHPRNQLAVIVPLFGTDDPI